MGKDLKKTLETTLQEHYKTGMLFIKSQQCFLMCFLYKIKRAERTILPLHGIDNNL